MSKKPPAHKVILQKLRVMRKKYDELEEVAAYWECHRNSRFRYELRAEEFIEMLTKIFIPKNARVKVVEELRKLPGSFFSPASRFTSGLLPLRAEDIFKKILG